MVKKLNILGCVPSRIEMICELGNESDGYNEFFVYKNIEGPEECGAAQSGIWNVKYFQSNHTSTPVDLDAPFTLSVMGGASKQTVHNHFIELFGIGRQHYTNLIHPTAYVAPSAILDLGIQIEPLSIVSTGTSVGFGVHIKRGGNVGHHCHIGDFVSINPGATISGLVRIGAGTTIGTGAVIKDQITIGKNSIIGAGSVVVKDIPDNVVAFGNPCKPHRSIH